jgi:hypothetical protein
MPPHSMPTTRFPRPHARPAEALLRALAACLAVACWSTRADSQLVPCERAADTQLIEGALAEIERSVDPCGESAQVSEVLETLRRCHTMTYRICTGLELRRNEFERPTSEHGEPLPRTIHWNPALHSELERGCGSDKEKPVLRDPTASLLHELVHAAYDCQGLNPGEHEIEAVRIENVYRRAAGLCQRSAYGDVPLPPRWTKDCAPDHCSCTSRGDSREAVASHGQPSGAEPGAAARTGARLGDGRESQPR